MKLVIKPVSLILLTIGISLLALSAARYRLPYENDRYFDPQTQVVYHLQAAELYLVGGMALTVVGMAMALVGFRAMKLKRP